MNPNNLHGQFYVESQIQNLIMYFLSFLYVDPEILMIHNFMQDGLIFHGKLIKVNLLCGICDVSARAMVKGIEQFSSRYGCCQCEQIGHYDGKRKQFSFTVRSKFLKQNSKLSSQIRCSTVHFLSLISISSTTSHLILYTQNVVRLKDYYFGT